MNEIQVFNNAEFGEVRTVTQNGEPWFVAADVCKALEIGNSRMATERLDTDEKAAVSLTDISYNGVSQQREYTIVNEPGLYSLVLGSRKPEAKAFKRWITHEVIPSIRKHGMYAVDELIANPDLAIAALTALKEERAKRIELESTCAVQTQQIAEMQPKASYYDLILNCKDLMSVTKIAKDYGKSAIWLNEKLHELGAQYKQGDIWLLYQKYAAKGYTSTKTHDYLGNDGENHAKVSTYWTQKGRLFIYELLKDNGILPMMEREDE
ncbi:MAG: phage antirepressor KilAC domain-containing protein [Kiritimatiellae bacterium]|nr:phage antirepressor KilAC domain-containing protein [Kiritimatiellia bacterium]